MPPREHAGRRHERLSRHTGDTGDNPLLTLVVRGHVKSPQKHRSGLARPADPVCSRIPTLYIVLYLIIDIEIFFKLTA